MNAFYTRIKSRKAKYKQCIAVLAGAEGRIMKQKERRAQRKQDLFHRRFSIAQTHPFLQHHVPILQRLGVNGMSEDESDCDDLADAPGIRSRPPRYYVVRPAWRARNLTAWLQTFDSMHILMRRMTGEPSRGAYPRQRTPMRMMVNGSCHNITQKFMCAPV